ncbi:MAG: transposase [Steroidobacteraceae bacterium]
MARHGRLHVPRATYFVVDRFRPGLDALVASPRQPHSARALQQIAARRERFESLIRYLAGRWCAHLHAYCWLPDAALLLLTIGEAPLEHLMHTLRGLYSQRLREEDSRASVGAPIHAGRYSALLVDPEDYLLDFARHIFWSPVRAGLCKTPLGYELSSARESLGTQDPGARPLCDSTLATALAQRGQHSRLGFARFLDQAPSPGFVRLLARGSSLDRRVAGSTAFVRQVKQAASRAPTPLDRESIIAWTAARLAIAPESITGRSRSAPCVRGRALVAWLATCSGAATLSEVARWLRCEPSTLSRAIAHHAAENPELFSEAAVGEFAAAMAAGRLGGFPGTVATPAGETPCR